MVVTVLSFSFIYLSAWSFGSPGLFGFQNVIINSCYLLKVTLSLNILRKSYKNNHCDIDLELKLHTEVGFGGVL